MKWNKKVTSLAAGALLVVPALGVVAGSSAAAKGQVTITFWNEMTGPYKPVVSGEIKNFEKHYPNIKVEDITIPNDAALRPKLLAAIVGGDPPTISQMNPPWATGFEASKSLVNLSNLIKSSNGISKASLKDFYSTMLQGGQDNNHVQWLMPFNLSAAEIFYNVHAFHQAGIQAPPTDWRAFQLDARLLSGHGDHAFAITLVHSYPWLAFFYAAGGHFTLPNGQPNPAAFAPNGPAVKTLALWTNMVHTGTAVLTQGYASQTDFANQTSSILEGTSAFWPYLKQAVGNSFQIGVAPMPKGVVKGTALFGGYLGIFSHSSPAQQQAAWDFVRYLTSTDGSGYWLGNTHGYLPVRKSSAQIAKHYLDTHPAQLVALSELPYAHPEGHAKWWSEFSNKILINAIQSALLGQKTPQKAIADAYTQVKALAK